MLKRRRGALKRMDAPFASTCIIVQPKTPRANHALTRSTCFMTAQSKGLAKAKAATRELKVIDAEV